MKLHRYLTICGLLMMAQASLSADELVILRTNDTHSQLDPDDSNQGGILRRKVLVDSVRSVRPNVMLIDCGDAVQGSLYFTLYRGEAERVMMNMLGYDIQILGNHEFDNGLQELANQWQQLNAERLSTNYDVSGTPLEGVLKPYSIHTVAGRKIGFIAINLDPKGMISDKNAVGITYLDGIDAANSMAWFLKHILRADMVVAITHVGYDTATPPTPSDIDMAKASKEIDIFLGGHSHTTVDPSAPNAKTWRVNNAAGRPVVVAQTGGRGTHLGEVVISLDSLSTVSYRLIPVDSRLDSRIDPTAAATLAAYRTGVNELKTKRIARSAKEMVAGSSILVNWVADAMLTMGRNLTSEPIALAIVNKGGIRRGLPAGDITKETIMTMLPFDNKLVVMRISGRDLAEALEIMKQRGGDGLSDGFDVTTLRPDSTYTIVTIDYLAEGGDYMVPLTRGEVVKVSPKRLDETMIDYLEHRGNKTIKFTDSVPRLR